MGGGTVRIGTVEIAALSDADGSFDIPTEHIVPGVAAQAWEPYHRRYPEAFTAGGQWRVRIGSFLLRSDGRTVLVDTGMGPYPFPPFPRFDGMRGRLPDEFTRLGVAPAEIDVVFLTHWHADHVGWNLATDGRPTFPAARYLLHQADWAVAQELDEAGGWPSVARSLLPLGGLGCLDLLAGETRLTAELTALPTPGHTPGHMSVLIVSGDERALITGDVVSNPAQVSEPDWRPVFDQDPDLAVATRRALLDRIETEGMTVAAGHFPTPGFGRIVRLEGRRYWQAI